MCTWTEDEGGYHVGCNGIGVDDMFPRYDGVGWFNYCPWCGGLISWRDRDAASDAAWWDAVNDAVDSLREGEPC